MALTPMPRRTYVGSEPVINSFPPGSGTYVVIKVRDLGGALQKQLGAVGLLVSGALRAGKVSSPSSIDAFVSDQFAPELRSQLASEGVVADVYLSTAPPAGGTKVDDFTPFLLGAAVGASAVGLAWGLVKLLGKHRV